MYINGCIIWYVYHHWDLMVIDQLINGTIWCIYLYIYIEGNDMNGVLVGGFKH